MDLPLNPGPVLLGRHAVACQLQQMTTTTLTWTVASMFMFLHANKTAGSLRAAPIARGGHKRDVVVAHERRSRSVQCAAPGAAQQPQRQRGHCGPHCMRCHPVQACMRRNMKTSNMECPCTGREAAWPSLAYIVMRSNPVLCKRTEVRMSHGMRCYSIEMITENCHETGKAVVLCRVHSAHACMSRLHGVLHPRTQTHLQQQLQPVIAPCL